MPINPIDLQTIFVQLGQVGKQQAAEKDGAVLHSMLHGAQIKKLEDEAAKAIQKPKDDQTATEPIKDEGGSAHGEQEQEKKRDGDAPKKPEQETISDPALGGHIDISG
jgi:hypothetical protein